MALGFGQGAGTGVDAQPYIRDRSNHSGILGKFVTILILCILDGARILGFLFPGGCGLNGGNLSRAHLALLSSAVLEINPDPEDGDDHDQAADQPDLKGCKHHFSGTSFGGTAIGAIASLSFVTRPATC